MNSYLRPLVSCCLFTTIIRQRKKDITEIEEIEEYSQNVYVRIVYDSFECVCVGVCVCGLYLRIFV